MNFLKVRVVKKNENISLETDTAKIQVPNNFTENLCMMGVFGPRNKTR